MKLQTIAAVLITAATASAQTGLQYGVYRPPNTLFNGGLSGQWLLRLSSTPEPGNPMTTTSFGGAGEIPLIGDFNGNGTNVLVLYRPPNTPANPSAKGCWHYPQGSPNVDFCYGGPGDIPVVGDWTGRGKTTIGVFHPAGTQFASSTQAAWSLRNSNTDGPADASFYYGGPGDIPVVGDWTGSGKTTIGVFQPAGGSRYQAQWLLRTTNMPGPPDITLSYGGPGDVPVTGDWTGGSSRMGGPTTIGVFRPANTQFNGNNMPQWLLRNTNTQGPPDISFYYGLPGDTPVVGRRINTTLVCNPKQCWAG